jgi:hypothetical protein
MVPIQELNCIAFGHLGQPQLSIGNDVLCDHPCLSTMKAACVELHPEVGSLRRSTIKDLLGLDEANLELGALAHYVEDILKINVIDYSSSL